MSSVGTKKPAGDEDMRSRNLIAGVIEENVQDDKPCLRVITSHAVLEGHFILGRREKVRFRPAQLMHLVDKRALSKDLHDIRVLRL